MDNTVTIPLTGMAQAAPVLAAIGDRLCLGGPDGNHPVRDGETKGWGMNWDALFDCLLNLHSGGIWGTSPVPAFPLHLRFVDAGLFAQASPAAFAILQDLLRQTRETHARQRRDFGFDIRL